MARKNYKEVFASFQFTHPGRGATALPLWYALPDQVSIHAPREGCDQKATGYHPTTYEFQFTHPGRGATG